MGARAGADCDSDMNIMSLVFSVNLSSNLLADEVFFLAPSLKDVSCVNPQISRVTRRIFCPAPPPEEQQVPDGEQASARSA